MAFLAGLGGSAAGGAAAGGAASGAAGAAGAGAGAAGMGAAGLGSLSAGGLGTAMGATAANVVPAVAAAAPTVGPLASAAASSPGFWSQLGSTMGQFGKDYAAGYANPMSGGYGFNANTAGQLARMGDMGGENMIQNYLQQKNLEEQRKQRGY